MTNSVSVASGKRSTLQESSFTTMELDCSTCGNFSREEQHSTTTVNANKDPIKTENIRIASLNSQSLKKDVNLGLAIELCKQFNIQILGVQESWRTGSEYIEFGENKDQWKWINYGYEKKNRAGVGFIVGPNVQVIKTVEHLPGRILTIYVKCYGLCIRITNVYAPTEVENLESKQRFYKELRKAMVVEKLKKYKPLLVGDFNAIISEDSREGFATILGPNNPPSSTRKTNENGRLLLEFCQEYKLRIANSNFLTKRIHRDTHTLPNGINRRLDYILAGTQLLKLMKHCRVYNKPTNSWKQTIGTDHKILISDISIPCNRNSLKQQLKKKATKKVQKGKWDVTHLRDDAECKKQYCKRIDSILSDCNFDCTAPEEINKNIVYAIHEALDSEIPVAQKEKELKKPWESSELLDLIKNSDNSKEQRDKIKKLKLKLKNEYYEKKANELNDASNARKVEREFALSKNYSMIPKLQNRVEIKPSDLKSYFEDHFKKRADIEMPAELANSEKYPDLFNDRKIEINSNPPEKEEIISALKSFNNGKSFGTDNIPPEGLKYGIHSNHLITALWMLLNSIWLTMTIPADWLKLSITCLHKKGGKHQASNYRALSVGSNISKILSKIIITRLKECYEENISKAQFGFRRDRSTTDGVFLLRQIIKNTEGGIIALYIDLTAAFDKVPRHIMYEVLKVRTGCEKLVDILWLLYDGTIGKICGDKTDFPIEAGTRQGGVESPPVFNWFFDWVLKVAAREIDQRFPNGWGIPCTYTIANACHQRSTGRMNGVEIIKWLLYADDVVVLSKDLTDLQEILEIIHGTCLRYGLELSFKKTKTQVFHDAQLMEKKSLLNISGHDIENVKEFKYLGHMFYSDQKESFVDNRILSATGKFHELKNVLTDHKVSMNTRRKLLESCIRSRLTYCTEAELPNEDELKKLESCWFGLLRRMVRNGWERKMNSDGEETFAFKYRNLDLERIVGTLALHDFIYIRYLKYIAHVCRRPNSNLTKQLLFAIPSAKYVRDPWIKISQLLNVDKHQAKKSTQDRKVLKGLLHQNFGSV